MNQKNNKITFKFTDNKEQNSEYEYIAKYNKLTLSKFHVVTERGEFVSSDSNEYGIRNY